MSFDLGVWAEDGSISAEVAAAKYRALCAGDTCGLIPTDRIAEFCAELFRRYPASPTDVPDEDLDRYPWASAVDVSPGHVLLPIVRTHAAEVTPVVVELANRHALVCFNPQTNTVHQRGSTQPDQPLRLRMADGRAVDGPSPQRVRQEVRRLSPDNWYAILEREPERYVQVGWGRNAGAPDGWYGLEFRDGDAAHHYRCLVDDLDEVVEAFAGFAAGGPDWAGRFAWQAVTL